MNELDGELKGFRTSDRRVRLLRAGLLASAVVALLAACATAERALLPSNDPRVANRPLLPAPMAQRAPATAEPAEKSPSEAQAAPPATAFKPTPTFAGRDATIPPKGRAASPYPADEVRDISLNFDQTPLPTFIQVVFGNILKSTFLVDPAVAQRVDMVTLRTSQPQNRGEVLETARLLLKTFGVSVVDVGGAYRIVPDSAATGFSPDIQRGRALPDVPQPMRPVFFFYELQSVRVQEAAQWLRAIFGNRIQFTEDAQRNALMLSGLTDSVASVIDALQVLDQPRLRGRTSVRIEPAYWSADDLARRLSEVLTAEGWQVGTQASGNQPIILLPIAAINSIIAFSVTPTAMEHVARWAKELDQPGSSRTGGGTGFFTYSVRNTDARELAKTLQELLAGAAPAGQGAQAAAQRAPARVVVNPGTNTLILQGAPDSYTQFVSLLRELDQPARTALIEVTVAEVRLSENESLGVEWAMAEQTVNGNTVRGGTLGGLGIGTGGLTIRMFSSAGEARAVINALASTNRARVLSSPRLMARNGEQASIQVGQEVPIITSQQTTSTGIPTAAVLQTIQYKQVGVILRVRPIIHSSGRIELDVSQEVSSASSTQTGVNNSPTISNRKVDTKLALADGSTVLLAGLISQNATRGDTGVPFLKDVPVIGQLFRVNNDTSERTELIVLITPYLVNNDFEARAITDAFRSQLGPWAQTVVGAAAVVLPPTPAPTPAGAPLQSPEATRPQSLPASGTPAAPPEAASSAPVLPKPQSAPPPSSPPAPTVQTPGGSGVQVDDPKLLEELQRGAGGTKPKGK
jgi:general secretion pathway protein D